MILGDFKPNYEMKPVKVDAHKYDHSNVKPWVKLMIEKGIATETLDEKGRWLLAFGNKRDDYSAYEGDFVVRDEINHVRVISASTFDHRCKGL